MGGMFRWLSRNLGPLLIAFVLAVLVWVSAVISADPNVLLPLEKSVVIEFIGKDPTLKIMGEYRDDVVVTIEAPRSVWESLNTGPSAVRAWVDLSGITPGEYLLPVQVEINSNLARLTRQDPVQINLTLEALISRMLPISLETAGEPPLGYAFGLPLLSPSMVTISGPSSLVDRVRLVRAQIDLTGATESITRTLNISVLDSAGRAVTGLTVSPSSVLITQPVALLGGYRNVIVKVVTAGIVANGYRLTNYFASPASVVVFSSDPRIVSELPGYVETLPLDLTGATDDFEALLELNLPENVTVVTDSRVLVQVSIAAIETSLTVSIPVEITGLDPSFIAEAAPATVDLIVSGPVPVLSNLKPGDIRVKVDLSGFEEGVHQVIPIVDFLPARVQKVSILPTTVEVTIRAAPTPTTTPTPNPQ
jgi:YbbR domain-containing protein